MEKRKVALITGATRGIGKAIALNLAKQGINLALAGRSENELEAVSKEAREEGVETLCITCDLNDPLAPKQVVIETIHEFRRIDYLINNAGCALQKSLIDTSTEDWDWILTVNAKAPFFICQYALPYLRKSTSGTIINISSVTGRHGYEMQSAYAASKHALNGFSKALAREEQKNNIRVHLIAPGGVATDMVKQIRPDLEKEDLIQPEEIGKTVSFLINNRGNSVIDEINMRRVNAIPFN